MTEPCPETKYIPYRNYGDLDICLRYYTNDSLQYLLLRFLEYRIGNANGQESQTATRRLLEVVLLFDDKYGVDDFSTYVNRHLGSFDELVSKEKPRHIEDENLKAAEMIVEEICNSQALIKMKKNWKVFCEENDNER